jgi:hypothetical protein
MNSNTNKTSRQLSKEVRNQLNAVESDIDRLTNRLSPGRFIDDAVFARYRGNPRATFDHLKENPLGTTFLTLGTILLMEDENHNSYESLSRKRASSTYSQTQDRANSLMADAKDKVSDIKEGISSKMPHKEHTAGQAPNKMDIAKSRINSTKENLVSKAQETIENVKHKYESKDQDATSGSDIGLGTNKLDTGLSADSSGSNSFQDKKEDLRAKAQEGLDSLKNKVSGDSSTPGSLETSKDKLSSRVSETKEKLSSRANETLDKARHSFDSTKESVSSRAQEQLGNMRSKFDTDSVKESVRGFQPMAFMALGAGLGALTGASLESDDEYAGNIEERMSDFNHDLQNAVNESANILKNEFMSDFKEFNVNFF